MTNSLQRLRAAAEGGWPLTDDEITQVMSRYATESA
jgi:hypothetical protein